MIGKYAMVAVVIAARAIVCFVIVNFKNKEMKEPLWDKLKEYEGNYPEDYSHENGNYMNVCGRCGSYFIGHKRRVRCKICLTNRSETPDS